MPRSTDRPRRRLAALAAVTACVAAAPPAAEATIVAVQDDRLAVAPAEAAGERAALVRATGARWTRLDVFWSEVAPTRPRRPADPDDPAYRWEALDARLRALEKQGVRALLCVYSTPRWAAGGRRDTRWTPNPFQFAAFMVALGKRYSGRHRVEDGRLPKVTHFELWNEPNMQIFFRPQWRKAGGRWQPYSPILYSRLVKVTTPRLRKARPDALVIAGALGPTSTNKPGHSVGIERFILEMRRQRPPLMAVSQHVYPGAPPGRSRALPSIQGMPRILRLWDGIRRGVPMYVTETGYTTAESPYRRYQVSERQQASFLPKLLRGLSGPRVRMVVWFNLQDHEVWPGGLVDADGRRKPSWNAFRAQAKR